ncbi:MAG: glucose-6-phosphate dehydrogenase [Chroococcidiopsis sp.]
MTVITAADIPSSATTSLEKLAAWVGLALARCNPTARLLEDPNTFPQRICETVMVRADDNSLRLVVRVSIPIADGYAENAAKFWNNANEISNSAVLPAAFKAN